MDMLPRQKLRELVEEYGSYLYETPKRCEGFLRDVCGDYRKEVNLLVNAVRQGIVEELLRRTGPTEALLARLAKILEDEQGITNESARWAVESWAFALGIELPKQHPEPTQDISSSKSPQRKKEQPPLSPPTQPVAEPPKLEVSQTSFSFVELKPNTSYSDNFTLNNVGGGNLTGDITTDRTWLKVGQNQINISRCRQNIPFAIDCQGLPYGFTDVGRISLRTDGGNQDVIVKISIEMPGATLTRFKKFSRCFFGLFGMLIGMLLFVVYHDIWGIKVIPFLTYACLVSVPLSAFILKKFVPGLICLSLIWFVWRLNLAPFFPIFWALTMLSISSTILRWLFTFYTKTKRSSLFFLIYFLVSVSFIITTPFYLNGLIQWFKSLNKSGNTVGNLLNGGFAAYDDGWIYYANSPRFDQKKGTVWDLCKMKNDGTGQVVLVRNISPEQINVLDNWIYFLGHYGIYKVRTNGMELTKMQEGVCKQLLVHGKYIFYSRHFEDSGIYRINIDGSHKKLIKRCYPESFCYQSHDDSGFLYYIDDYKINSIDIQSKRSFERLNSDQAFGVQVGRFPSGHYIYYLKIKRDHSYSGPMYRRKIYIRDGNIYPEEVDCIHQETIWNTNISDDRIYYCSRSGFFRMELDGSNVTKICNENLFNFSIVGSRIVYSSQENIDAPRYMIKIDGSNKQHLDIPKDISTKKTDQLIIYIYIVNIFILIIFVLYLLKYKRPLKKIKKQIVHICIIIFICIIISIIFLQNKSYPKTFSLDKCSELNSSIAISPDNNKLAVISDFSGQNTIKIWDIKDKKLLWKINGSGPVLFSPNNKFLAYIEKDAVRLFDIQNGNFGYSFGKIGKFHIYSFSSEGNRIIVSNNKGINVWDIKTGKLIQRILIPIEIYENYDWYFSVDLNVFAKGNLYIYLWDAINNKQLPTIRVQRPSSKKIFSFNNKRLYILVPNWAIRVYDVQTGDWINTLAGVYNYPSFRSNIIMEISSNGKMIASQDSGRIKVWNLTTKRLIREFDGHKTNVTALTFSLDNKFIVSFSGEDGIAKLWKL